jgi:hypothetical protein
MNALAFVTKWSGPSIAYLEPSSLSSLSWIHYSFSLPVLGKLHSVLSSWIYPFKAFHIRGITQYYFSRNKQLICRLSFFISASLTHSHTDFIILSSLFSCVSIHHPYTWLTSMIHFLSYLHSLGTWVMLGLAGVAQGIGCYRIAA